MALIVIEMDTRSSGRPSVSTRMSSIVAIATPTLPTSPRATRIVRVVAHLRRQVEGHRKARLALLEQVAVAPVRLGGRAEPRVLAHRPVAAAVPLVRDAAGEGKLARLGRAVGRLGSGCPELVSPGRFGRFSLRFPSLTRGILSRARRARGPDLLNLTSLADDRSFPGKARGLWPRRPSSVDGAESPLRAVDGDPRPRPAHPRLEGRRDRLRVGLAAPPPPRRPPAAQRRAAGRHPLRAARAQHDDAGEPDAPDPRDEPRHARRPVAARRGARPQAPLRDLRVARGQLRVRPDLPRAADPAHRADPARPGARLPGRQAARRHAPPLAQGAPRDVGGRRRLGASVPARRHRGALLGGDRAHGLDDRRLRGPRPRGALPRVRPPAARAAHPQLPDAAGPPRHGGAAARAPEAQGAARPVGHRSDRGARPVPHARPADPGQLALGRPRELGRHRPRRARAHRPARRDGPDRPALLARLPGAAQERPRRAGRAAGEPRRGRRGRAATPSATASAASGATRSACCTASATRTSSRSCAR